LLPKAGPVLQPKGIIMHFEVELGLVIGKTVRDLEAGDTQGALDAIRGGFSLAPESQEPPIHASPQLLVLAC